MAGSVFEPGFNMQEYLTMRALEIPDLSERKIFKGITEKMMLELYQYTQNEFLALETRIFGELESVESDYAIYIGLVDRAHYDATDPFLHPILSADAEAPVYSIEDLQACLSNGRPYPLYSIFLEADYRMIQAFSAPGHIYHGVVYTEHGQYRAKCTVKPDTVYTRQLADLYRIFTANYRPWSTVCAAYLHKFFRVELISVEDIDPKETIRKICVEFEDYESYVRYDYFPLWNLKPISEKTSTYPEPCMDQAVYDHRIFAHRLNADRQYLVMNTDVEFTNIRRVNGDLIITCPEENPHQWELYQVDIPDKQSHTSYPVLSNLSRTSFTGNLSDRYRRGIKTRAEISRILSAYGYEDYAVFQDVVLEPYTGIKGQTYCMDDFIVDELRTEKTDMAMTLTFSTKRPDDFLTLDIVSFLVSQVQSLFPEYICQGKLL